jgi:hypothetical protein
VTFVPGLELSAAFYAEVLAPQLGDVPHSAALLGWGSDVLGYDTARSTDHGWGPRVQVFTDAPAPPLALPETFGGHPVRFGWDTQPPRSWVDVTRLPAWTIEQLGFDATVGVTTLDWLLTAQQRLLGVTAGAVFADPSGELGAVRRRLAWYPDAVWRWLLACQWHRLAEEEAFVSRAAEVGDELGARVLAARQVRELMRLVLLQQRRYAPYPKWLGTGFARCTHDDELPALLARALGADQRALGAAYLAVAARHDAGGLTDRVGARLRDYHDRPARVIMADRFASALLASVDDPFLRGLPLIGAVDQVVDCTGVLAAPDVYRRLAALYR